MGQIWEKQDKNHWCHRELGRKPLRSSSSQRDTFSEVPRGEAYIHWYPRCPNVSDKRDSNKNTLRLIWVTMMKTIDREGTLKASRFIKNITYKETSLRVTKDLSR